MNVTYMRVNKTSAEWLHCYRTIRNKSKNEVADLFINQTIPSNILEELYRCKYISPDIEHLFLCNPNVPVGLVDFIVSNAPKSQLRRYAKCSLISANTISVLTKLPPTLNFDIITILLETKPKNMTQQIMEEFVRNLCIKNWVHKFTPLLLKWNETAPEFFKQNILEQIFDVIYTRLFTNYKVTSWEDVAFDYLTENTENDIESFVNLLPHVNFSSDHYFTMVKKLKENSILYDTLMKKIYENNPHFEDFPEEWIIELLAGNN